MRLNVGYYVAKGLDMGLSLKEVETMSYHKLMHLLDSRQAVQAEYNLEQLHIIANPRLLESKKGAKEYPKLFKAFEKVIRKYGVKTITTKADTSLLEMLKAQQRRK